MLVTNLLFLHRRQGVALVILPSSGAVHVNAGGRRLLEQEKAAERLRSLAALVAERGLAQSAIVGDQPLVLGPLFNEQGTVEAILAVDASLAELPRLLEEARRPLPLASRLLAVLPNPLLVVRPPTEVQFCNRAWYEVTGMPYRIGELPTFQAAMNVFLDEPDGVRVAQRWEEGLATGQAFRFTARVRGSTGARWCTAEVQPVIERGVVRRWIVVFHDVHGEMVARQQLARVHRQTRFLADVTQILNTSTDLAPMTEAVLQRCAAEGMMWALDLGPSGRRVARARPSDGRLLSRVRTADRVVVGQVRGGEDYGSVAIGVSGDEPLEEWRELAEELARRLAVAVERVVGRERERAIAETLQRAMLPAGFPAIRGFGFDVAYAPAAHQSLVGGDWYDVFELGDGRLGITVGDVAGHGITAAIVMNQLRQLVRTVSRNERDPARVLAEANLFLLREGETFATAWLGVLDLLTLGLSYANAGHPPPYLVDARGGLTALAAPGTMLGVVPAAPSRSVEVDLTESRALVLYTDGVVEVQRNLLAGEALLRSALRHWAEEGLHSAAVDLQQRLVPEGTNSDDAALLIVRREPLDRLDASVVAVPANARRLRTAVRRFAEANGLGADEAFDLTVAIAEAVNNAIVHAYGEGPPGEVRVVTRRTRDGLLAAVEDYGSWPDLQAEMPGHGLDIMRRLIPRLRVRRQADGTRVVFRLVPGEPAAAAEPVPSGR